jgi:hypothetical protein
MVRAKPLEEFLKVVRLALGRRLPTFSLNSGHERVPKPLVVPLFLGAVGGAFVGVLILFFLALGVVKNHSDHLLA